MNLPGWLAGSRFFTSDTLCHDPVAVMGEGEMIDERQESGAQLLA